MRIVVLHNEPGEDAAVAETDVLVQLQAVASALRTLRHDTIQLSCTLDLESARSRLLELEPDVVFNLVESLGGTDRLMTLATMLLDALNLPYTGTSTEAILSTSNKLTSKQRMRAAGLPTPGWFHAGTANVPPESTVALQDSSWILKPVLEHASFGMDDNAVVTASDPPSLFEQLRERERQLERPCFAERFVAGREFNLSLLCGQVLPPAEIDFAAFPAGKPRIVGQRAKWDQDSFEYQQTLRTFHFPASDQELLNKLVELAKSCWRLFGMAGYARVDFRVDALGQPWILEVNANPCLAPDAGFAAALAEAGTGYEDAIQRIVDDALLSTALVPAGVIPDAIPDSLFQRP